MTSFKEAAIKILEREKEPLSAAEITELAIEQGLISSEGKTPEATMAAILYVDLKKEDSPFIKASRGKFSLQKQKNTVKSPGLTLQRHNMEVMKQLNEKLHEMDPFIFESFVAELLQKIGYEELEVTKRSGDQGIDIKAKLTVGGITDVDTIVQVKRYRTNVAGKTIRELRGSAEIGQRGLVITTAGFTKDAINEAKAPGKTPVSLIDGKKLIELLIKQGVGIKKEQQIIYSIDEDYFENEVSELRSLSTEKSRAMWPLPGGTDNYVETLDKILQYVKDNKPSKKETIKWFIDTFETVKSEKTTTGYIQVPKSMGLIDINNNNLALTKEGQEYLEKNNITLLYEIISKNVLGFDEILELLDSAKEPQKEQEILDYLNENLNLGWGTFAQVTFRLLWLKNLGKVEKIKEGWIIKNK